MDIAKTSNFDRVYREHRHSVFLTALRITRDPVVADDVTHDVFLRLWRRPERFDAARGDLLPYLRLMARSRALDLWREKQAAGRAEDRLKVVIGLGGEEARDADPAPRAIESERAEAVRDALTVLPDAQREAVVLAYWGGLTAEEIAGRTGTPLGTVKSRLRLGLAKLRPEVDGDLLAREAA